MSKKNEFSKLLDKIEINYSDDTILKFEKYKNLIQEWNKKINITAIDSDEEIYLKHFIDSVIIKKYVIIKEGAKSIDIGTGGGFPGIPLKILDNRMDITLLDSLNKRIKFSFLFFRLIPFYYFFVKRIIKSKTFSDMELLKK